MPSGPLLRLSVVLALISLVGCQRILSPADSSLLSAREQTLLATRGYLEKESSTKASPSASDVEPCVTPVVTTVANPELKRREVSLAECLALAMENGRSGEFFDRGGSDRRTSVSGLIRQASAVGATDSIRVFAFSPALLATEIDQSLAKFDAVWQTRLIWDRFDEGGPSLNTLAIGIPPTVGRDKVDDVQFRTELLKPLPTGGVAGITFTTDFENRYFLPPDSGLINPAYRPKLALSFEQPLLRGAGVEINQLRDSHPGGILNPVDTGGRVPGILLARIAHTQAQLEFERQVQEVVFRVEEAYWDLYAAYWDLYTRENGMKQAYTAWLIAKSRQEAGTLGIEDVAQIEEQFHSFRSQRLDALGRGSGSRPGVLEAERHLRYLVGLPPEDGTRLIPADAPLTVPLEPEWQSAYRDALARRPELLQIHQEIHAARLAIVRAQDLLKPDLRFISRIDTNGLGTELDDGLRSMAQNRYHDWELGLQMQVPLGFREGHAEVARARLLLGQRLAFLRDQEQKVLSSLQRSQRELVQFREEIHTRRSQEQAAAVRVRARFEKFQAGRETIDFLLRAQRDWADALRDEYLAVVNYNIALADFERQKGTTLDYHNILVADGPLPACAEPGASQRIHAWRQALAARGPKAASDPAVQPVAGPDLPELNAREPVPIPVVLEQHKHLPDRLDSPGR